MQGVGDDVAQYVCRRVRCAHWHVRKSAECKVFPTTHTQYMTQGGKDNTSFIPYMHRYMPATG